VRDPFTIPLPVPPYWQPIGEVVTQFGGDIICRRHFTRLGHSSYGHKPCPTCLRVTREHEMATRDD